MKNIQFLFYAIFFSLAFSGKAKAGPCAASGLCAGDISYFYRQGRIQKGTVNSITPDGLLKFQDEGGGSEYTIPVDRLAVTGSGKCSPEKREACVDSISERKDERGQVVEGKVVGYFPTGYVVLKEGDKFISISPDRVSSFHSAEAGYVGKKIPEVLAAVARLQVPVDMATSCDGVAAAPEPPQESPLSNLADSVKNGKTATLNDYLQYWNKADNHPDGQNPWAKCIDKDQSNHPAKHDESWNVVPECQPDTLYSWGPKEKIKDLESKMGNGAWQTRPYYDNALFLSESPASTFGYGSKDDSGGYAIRIRLKPGTHVKIQHSLPNCGTVSEEEAKETVYIRIFVNNHGGGKVSSGQDFVLCSSGPVQSWSYGTKQFYDELVNDVKRIRDPANPDDHLSYMTRPDKKGVMAPANFDLGSDSHPFTEAQLANTLKNQLIDAANDQGKVYYNPSETGADLQFAKDNAFTTKIPNWFNNKLMR